MLIFPKLAQQNIGTYVLAMLHRNRDREREKEKESWLVGVACSGRGGEKKILCLNLVSKI